MTPNEISTIIAERVKKQLDIPFKLMVFDLVKTWRSTLVKNTLERNPSMKSFFMQTLIVGTQPHSSAGCTLPTCLDSAITIVPIPQAIRTGVNPYSYVGGIKGNKAYSYGMPSVAEYLKENKYSQETVYWHKSSDKVILSSPIIANVRIDDVFDDPLEVAKLQCKLVSNGPCDVWNSPYPGITNDILQQCIQYVTEYILSNPSTPETEEEIKPDSGTQAS